MNTITLTAEEAKEAYTYMTEHVDNWGLGEIEELRLVKTINLKAGGNELNDEQLEMLANVCTYTEDGDERDSKVGEKFTIN